MGRIPYRIAAAMLTIILCFTAGNGFAADTLDQWVDAALVQNQEVISARKAWEAAQQKARQTRSFDDPMVGVDWMRMDSTRFDDYDQTEYMISQRLPWFGKRRARTDAAGLRADAEGFRYLETVRQVRARVRSAYWGLWAAHRALEINRKNRDLLEQLEAVARARYEAGQGLQADVLKAQVELARLENDLETYRSDFEVAQAAVNRLLSEPPDTPRLPPEAVKTPPLRWTLDEALYSARLYCCTLISYLLDLQAREAEVREARLQYAPDIEFRVMARQSRGRGGIDEYDTGVAINVPWLWRGKYAAGVREAQAEVERAQAEFDSEIDMTLFEVRDYHSRAQTELRTIRLFEDTILPRTHALLETTRAAYESGEIGFLDLIDAQRSWFDAGLALDDARARYASAVANLEAIAEPWQDYEIDTGLVTEDMR